MSKSDQWSTPPDLIKVLNDEFGFTLEVCAAADNRALPLIPYMGIDNGRDALIDPWSGVWFNNPPYSQLTAFTRMAAAQGDTGACGVQLIPAYLGTNYWHDIVFKAANEVRILKGRLTFWENGVPGPYPARFDSAVVIYRPTVGLGDATIRMWDWRAGILK